MCRALTLHCVAVGTLKLRMKRRSEPAARPQHANQSHQQTTIEALQPIRTYWESSAVSETWCVQLTQRSTIEANIVAQVRTARVASTDHSVYTGRAPHRPAGCRATRVGGVESWAHAPVAVPSYGQAVACLGNRSHAYVCAFMRARARVGMCS